MAVVYAIMILLGVYLAKAKSVDGGVKTFIIFVEIAFVVLSVLLEVIGG